MSSSSSERIQRERGGYRHHLSGHHLFSSYLFYQNAASIEQLQDLKSSDYLTHKSYVISSIISSTCFLEATINELYVTCSEHPDDCHVSGHPSDERFRSIGEDAIVKIGAFWQMENFQRNASILDKYQTALRLSCKDEFDKGINPYQDVKLSIDLRNMLVHFKPKEQPAILRSTVNNTFESVLRGKFSYNPIMQIFAILAEGEEMDWEDLKNRYPFFPEKCLSSDCAKWVFKSSLSFADSFFSRLGTTWYYHYLFDQDLVKVT